MMLDGRLGMRESWPAMVAVNQVQARIIRVMRVAVAWTPDYKMFKLALSYIRFEESLRGIYLMGIIVCNDLIRCPGGGGRREEP